ncbi:hypothetical protein [Aeoliella sp.]|uniref:hypothetical protein n=1 Tax=Aeoliella sp. TaxID=2795800 RepID=UPI003CCC2F43
MTDTSVDTQTQDTRPQRSRRWRFLPRFGIKWLLVFTTLACVFLAAWSVYIDPYRQQQAAVARIRKLEGQVSERNAVGPAWQQWMVETFLGDGSFVLAEQVELHQSEIPDDLREHLGRLPFVEVLKLDGAGIDDRTVAALMPGESVRKLSLRYTRVTDASMHAAAQFPHLHTLLLTGADVGDEGLEALAANQSLEKLFIRWTNVTEEGVAAFRQKRPDCEVIYSAR